MAQSEVAYLLNLAPHDVRRNCSHRRVTHLRSQDSMILFRSGDCARGSVTHVPIRLQGRADRHTHKHGDSEIKRCIDTRRLVCLRVFASYSLYSWSASRLVLVSVRNHMQMTNLVVTLSLNLAGYQPSQPSPMLSTQPHPAPVPGPLQGSPRNPDCSSKAPLTHA